MKVFISWSGTLSKQVAEALRDWLPNVLQIVNPYFTPSDIEKGTRWSIDIAKELESSQVGILCITRDNIHSDWILFEAGALSKSLDKSHVCPILFGITNTDLAGPLKQFQTTGFDKNEMHKMLGVINSKLGDRKLSQKTLDTVFDKWWPDLDVKVREILSSAVEPKGPVRSDRELIEEILQISRAAQRRSSRPSISPAAIQDLLENYILLHDQQATSSGGYQDALNQQKEMHTALTHMCSKYKGFDNDLDLLITKLDELKYSTSEEEIEEDEDIPF